MSSQSIRHAGRVAEVLIGLIYLLAAFMKVQNINLFMGQILAYQIFTSPESLRVVAFATVLLETFLGLSMVLGSPWRKAVLALSAAMLVFFSGVIVYAWQVHGLEDCGCFGSVSFTPPQAIAKNVVFLVLNGLAWYGLVHRGEAGKPMAFRAARIGIPMILALVFCVAIAPQMGKSRSQSPATPTAESPGPAPEAPAAPSGVFSGYEVTSPYGETFDLGSGPYLVVLLSMSCEHCMGAVPELNAFMAESALPPLVALCLEENEGDLEEFQAMTAAMFPMHSIGYDMLEWSRLLQKEMFPRLCYAVDGVVQASWAEEMPDYATLLAAVESAPSAETE